MSKANDMSNSSVAVVGVGGIFPDASTAREFWDNIKKGHVAIGPVPPERWDAELFWSEDRDLPDRTYSRIGGFVRNSDLAFDAKRFRIPPKTVESIDTIQRLALTAVAQALSNANLKVFPRDEEGREFDRSSTAVILGNSMGGAFDKLTCSRVYFPYVAKALLESPVFKKLTDSEQRTMLEELEAGYKSNFPAITEDSMPGELSNCIAGRIANAFDLRGPNFTTDAACASSMAALKSAMDGLRLGQFDTAVVGGVDQMMDPPSYVKFSKIGALSAEGSFPFDAKASGFVMGEGAGILVLKRLADAERDGDTILATVRGIGAASDGKGKGMTAPNPRGQRMAIDRAYADAGVSVASVGLFEAHGTSTVVGDATETRVLTDALRESGAAPERRPLGSVKSMIGHLKAAAGAASLVKCVYALNEKVLPPSAGFEMAPEGSPLGEGFLEVNTKARAWESDTVRRAGVSAFGFGGTNFHAVLEEYQCRADEGGREPTPSSGGQTKHGTGDVGSAVNARAGGAIVSSVDDVLSQVIAVFAERTGYEVSDLEPDFELEADLGIDTVKQAEILGELRESYGVSADEAFRLSDVSTLRAIATYLQGHATPAATPVSSLPGGDKYHGANTPWQVVMFGGSSQADAAGKASSALSSAMQWPLADAVEPGAADASTRIAFAADDLDGARKKAASATKRSARMLDAQGVFVSEGPSIVSQGEVAFVFPGQGSQFLGMFRDLAAIYPVVAKTFEQADEVLAPLLGKKLTDIVWASADSDAEKKAAELQLRQTEICQPAMLTADVAMFRLLGTYGVEADRVVGHSLGEYAACVAAGVLSFADALYAVSARGREMAGVKVEDNGKMASVAAGVDRVEPILASISGYVIAANKNCHSQTVIAGATSSVEEAIAKFAEEGIEAREIPVSHAFHSAIVAPASGPLRNVLRGLDIAAPARPILSNADASYYPSGKEEIVDLLARQLESPVEFIAQLERLYDDGVRLFVEVGPRRAATGFVRNVLGDKPYRSIATNHHKRPAIESLMSALALLSAEGVAVDLSCQGEDPLESGRVRPSAKSEVPRVQGDAGPERVSSSASISTVSVGVSGAALLLPTEDAAGTIEGSSFDRMLSGEVFIESLSSAQRDELVNKKIVRLEKTTGDFTPLKDLVDVIQLAGKCGGVDLVDDYGIDEAFVDSLDTTSRLAIAAAIDAVRDAGLPMVRHYRTTKNGKKLPDRWGLPDDVAAETGVIFASAFPGYDRLVEDVSAHVASRHAGQSKRELQALAQRLTSAVSDPGAKAKIDAEFAPMIAKLEDAESLYAFNRKFLLRILAMGHTQIAQTLFARGPNVQVNAACASGPLAIATALDWLRLGRCKRVVVVGADDATNDVLMPYIGGGFLAAGAATTESDVSLAAVPFGAERNGTIIGAGAAGLVIENVEEISRRGMRPIVEVLDAQFNNSAFHATRLNSPHICSLMSSFVDRVADNEGLSVADLAKQTFFMSHETYTPARGGSSQAEIDALRATFGDGLKDILIANSKGQTGHPMGANLEDVLSVKGLQRQELPAIAHLNNVDPAFEGLRFSRGGTIDANYGFHFAAGFGSQVAMVMFKRAATQEARLVEPAQYERWAGERTGQENVAFELEKRTLRVAESGGVEITALGIPSLTLEARDRVPAQVEPASTAMPPDFGRRSRPALLAELTALFAEQSGYDVGDLEAGFELEADLGIDTVKQAEIFTLIRERYGLASDEAFRLSDVPTLDAVADYVLAQMGAGEAGESGQVATPNVGAKPAAAVNSSPVVDRAQLLVELTALFAESSGYDVADLEADFELEADLGIDTVKQAEIFTEIRERYGMSKDEEFKLSEVQTLNAVADYVLGQLGGAEFQASSPPESGEKSSLESEETVSDSEERASTPAVASASLDRAGLLGELTQLFAEQSGYEVSDLEPAFELEADLGIDTVKQAEILTVIRERYGMASDDAFKLSDVPTLDAVVDYVLSQLGQDAPEAPSTETEPSASASHAMERDQLLAELTTLFAEQTGYEASDLESAYELEADLGIDTVKQAEVFTVIRERYGLPKDESFKLSEVQTLEAVVDYVLGELGKSPEGASLGKPQGRRSQSAQRYAQFHVRPVVEVTLPELDTSATVGFSGRHVVLAGAGDPAALAVREVLLERGANVHSLSVEALTDEALELRLRDLGGATVDDIIVVAPERIEARDVETTLTAAYRISRAFARAVNKPQGARLGFFVRGDGRLAMGETGPGSHVVGGFCGLAKALAKEYPTCRVAAVCSARELALKDALGRALDELCVAGPGELGHGAKGERVTLVRGNPESIEEGALAKGAVLIATGGARGVTYEIVKTLAGRTRGLNIVLVGRTSPCAPADSMLTGRSSAELKELAKAALKARGERPTPAAIQRLLDREQTRVEIHQNIEFLEGLGARLTFIAADVSEPAGVAEVAKSIGERYGKVDVLLHGAGCEESKLIKDKSGDAFLKTYAAKTRSGLALIEALGPKRTVFMGSVAGRFGNAGQTDYALANECLAAASRGGASALCIDWTAWGDLGMAAKESVQRVLTDMGVEFLPAAEGALIGADLIASDLRGDVVVAGKLGSFATDDDGEAAASFFDSQSTVEGRGVYLRRFNPLADRGLDHHRIDGVAVLPGVLGVELMARAACEWSGRTVVAMEKVHFSTPVKFHRDAESAVSVTVETLSGDRVLATLSTTFVGPGGKAKDRKHFDAVVFLGERLEAVASPIRSSLEMPRDPKISRQALYERYFHGPAFQVLNSVEAVGEDGVEASSMAVWEEWLGGLGHDDFITSPLLRESGFQAAGVWEMSELGRMALPSAIDRIAFGPKPTHSAHKIEVRRRTFASDGAVFDVVVKDGSGQVVDVMTGYRTIMLRHLEEDQRFEPARDGMPTPNWLSVEVQEIESMVESARDATLERYLAPEEQYRFKSLRTAKRRLEWLAGRIAAKRLIREARFRDDGTVVSYPAITLRPDELGAPQIEIVGEEPAHYRVSISHSDGVAAALVTTEAGLAPGIDVEAIESRAPGFARDYFRQSERELAQHHSGGQDEMLTIMWAIKEAMLKALGIGARVDFRDLEVSIGRDGAYGIECHGEAAQRLRELRGASAAIEVELADKRVVARVTLPVHPEGATAGQSSSEAPA